MGKIRVKTIGDETLEEEQKKEAKKKQETKKTAKAPGLKGGERVVSVGPSEEEIAKELETEGKTATTETQKKTEAQKLSVSEKFSDSARPQTPERSDGGRVVARKVSKKAKFVKKQTRSSKYQTALKLVDRNKIYSLTEALEILPKLKLSNFDETVELHVNLTEQGISGNFSLPHGTGKETRVAIASDQLIAEVEKGKIEFDVLLAEPSMMPKLAKVARFLGPKGLMPNPKNGTITQNPEEVAKKYQAGFAAFKTESKAPIIHLVVGKLSFGDKKLLENIKVIFTAIPLIKIKSVTLKSTMSPGLKLDLSKI